MNLDAKTAKSELTRAAIVGAGLNLVATEGLEALTLQAVADRVGLSKSGVFSRVGSREALQKAVIEEFGRRFLADVELFLIAQGLGMQVGSVPVHLTYLSSNSTVHALSQSPAVLADCLRIKWTQLRGGYRKAGPA